MRTHNTTRASGLISSNGVNGAQPSEANPNGSGIQGAFKLTYFQDGLIPAAFMVGPTQTTSPDRVFPVC